jgi:hypothetical protein
MQFGILAGNDYINKRIYKLLSEIHPADVASFVRKFLSESDEQCFHTYRELILGSHLRSQGSNWRYEQKIGRQTPDWVVRDSDDQVIEIVDVYTLHQRRETDVQISKGLSFRGSWAGWVTIPPNHLFSKIQQKGNAYTKLIEKLGVPYVVAVFGEFTASVEPEEVHHVVNELHGGVFHETPTLAGVIFFRERSGDYEFSYFANPRAAHSSQLALQG